LAKTLYIVSLVNVGYGHGFAKKYQEVFEPSCDQSGFGKLMAKNPQKLGFFLFFISVILRA
jgi:hypothetical protein